MKRMIDYTKRPTVKPDEKVEGRLLKWKGTDYVAFEPVQKRDQDHPARTYLKETKNVSFYKNEGEKENSRLRAFSEKLQKVFLSDDKRRKEETSLPDSLLTALLASLAIQLAMLPILLFFYGEVSLSGIFLNLLVLPTAGIVLGCAVFTLLAGEGLFLLSGMAAVKNAGLFAVPGRLLLRPLPTRA